MANAGLPSEESEHRIGPGIEEMGVFLVSASSTKRGWIRSALETVTSRTSSWIRGVLLSLRIRIWGKLSGDLFSSEDLSRSGQYSFFLSLCRSTQIQYRSVQ